MSSTRRATADAELNQERWCSSPEFNHALNAMAVAKRAQILREPRMRGLVWFLQWRSLRPNGLQEVAEEIIALFPERLGTPTMRRLGFEEGRIYSAEEVRAIRAERNEWEARFRLQGEPEVDAWGLPLPCARYEEDQDAWMACVQRAANYPTSYAAAKFLSDVQVAKEGLVEHLKRICLDPEIRLAESPATGLGPAANVWWFDNLVGALLDYRERSIQIASESLAKTHVSAMILEGLDFCFRQRRMVLIEGNPGVGKSVTTRAFCEMQAGMVRHVETPASSDEKSFFVKIAAALGVANGAGYNGQQVKLRVEEVLAGSGLGLVLDECSRLWPQFQNPRGMPGRMLWLMTMREVGTPFALCGFKFSDWRELYTKKTHWPDEQFERRCNRSITLPDRHPEEDLFKIAEALLPAGDRASHFRLASIARINPRKGASAMVEVMITARDLCEQEGLGEVTFEVLERAIGINHPELQAPEEEPAPSATRGESPALLRARGTPPREKSRVPGHRDVRPAVLLGNPVEA